MTYTNTAQNLASMGRNGDDTLLHVNRNELAGLQALLGPVSVNPKTGMPEAYGWTSMLGSLIGGLGSFGAGAVLEPVISETIAGKMGSDFIESALSKIIPAAVGAGIGAAVGGATGGKGGALGGAVQGFMSGGLGAYGSEDVLGKGPTADPLDAAMNQAKTNTADALYKTSPDIKGGEWQPTDSLYKPDILKTTTPDATSLGVGKYIESAPVERAGAYSSGAGTSTLDQLGSNFSRLYDNLSQGDNLKNIASDYAPYLFQAGLIGQGFADQTNANDYNKKQQENYRNMQRLRNWQADQMVNKMFAGIPQYYADGGPVSMGVQGPLPVKVTIPRSALDEAEAAGGLENLNAFANGGFINTQQVNPEAFYPQSQIPKAQPYLAATPIRHEVLNNFAEGGYIDGDGDGQSDDIDADIDGQEPVKVADGEFVVPKHIVDMIGSDRLEELLKQVREASYGRDEQIPQNAGRLAAQRLLERYA